VIRVILNPGSEVTVMRRVVEVAPRAGFHIWARFDDEPAGTIDVSDLADRGVFTGWRDRRVFESVHVTDGGAVEWPADMDLCPDAPYLRLTGQPRDAGLLGLKPVRADA
jgi:hypothetical protein